MLNLKKTGEARAHLFYRQLSIVNEFLSMAMFDTASDAAAAGAGAGDTAAKATADKATADAAAAKGDAAPGSLMDDAAKEAKATTDAENKRLLEAKDEDLDEADKTKKAALIEANKAAEAAKGSPEKYEFKAPEGFTLDQALVEKFTPLAKELNLSQEKAQKLVDMYSGIVKANIEAQALTFTKFVEDMKAETIKELGANYKQELSFAAKARDRFASPELIDKLNQSGLSNDKDMVKLFITIGKAISEDKPPEGKSAPASGKTAGEILFPSAAKK